MEHLNTILAEKYQLIKSIGIGAYGEVFQAKTLQNGRLVAVKIFYRQLEEQTLRYIFKELKIISALSHPHILKVLAYGRGKCNGPDLVHYLVTPIMEGGSLSDILKKKLKMGIGESSKIAIQIANALAYMHANRFIHRDVKPQNILGDKSLQNFVLADFGITCIAECLQTKIAGTIEYCAPEQLETTKAADYRMDIYGLGMTLYEMLTSINPYRQIAQQQGEAAAIKFKYVFEYPLASHYNPEIPYGLCLVIKKMIANNANERYPNMQQVIQELQPYTTVNDMEILSTRTEIPRLPVVLKEIFNEANRLRQAKNWPGALGRYNAILAQMPNCAQAYFGRGTILLQCKQYVEAIQNFTLAIKHRPNSYSAYCQRSQAQAGLGNMTAALQDLASAIELAPQKPEAFFYRANLYRKIAKQYAEAKDQKACEQATHQMKQDLARYQQLKSTGEEKSIEEENEKPS